MQKVSFSVSEEEHPAAAAGGFEGIGEFCALSDKGCSGFLDGSDLQCQMTPASQRVVASLLKRRGGLVNFEHQAAGQGHEKGGRCLAVVEDEFRAQDAKVPVLERARILGGQSEVFSGEFHGEI